MTRLLITGGSGYLGRRLTRLAAAHFELGYTYFSQDPLGLEGGRRLDLRDEAAVSELVRAWRPEAIIHTAGSNRPAHMEEVIVRGAAHISAAAAAAGARLVHVSTDALFDGTAAPYDETAAPSPITAYGRAKAAAEHSVAGHPNHVIVRTSLIYGLDEMDHSTAWTAAGLRAGRPVTLFLDQLRNPVWIDSLAGALLELVEHPLTGVLNVAGRQPMSRADFGLRLLDWWGVEERETLLLGPADPAWPLDCRLDLGRAQAVLHTDLPGVDEALAAHRPIW
ncbi:MAG: SDR family oxidoreductase [Candidatus Promineifilaceae bacterium]